jgi:hypothetical protein
MDKRESTRKTEGRKPYEKPELRAIDLPMEETMAEGCKLGTDISCQSSFEPGS